MKRLSLIADIPKRQVRLGQCVRTAAISPPSGLRRYSPTLSSSSWREESLGNFFRRIEAILWAHFSPPGRLATCSSSLATCFLIDCKMRGLSTFSTTWHYSNRTRRQACSSQHRGNLTTTCSAPLHSVGIVGRRPRTQSVRKRLSSWETPPHERPAA